MADSNDKSRDERAAEVLAETTSSGHGGSNQSANTNEMNAQKITSSEKVSQEISKVSFLDHMIGSIIQMVIFFVLGGMLYALTAGIWWFFGFIPGIISCLIIVYLFEQEIIEKLIFNMIGIEYSKIKVKNSLTKFVVVGTLVIGLFHIAVIYFLLKLFPDGYAGVVFNAFFIGGMLSLFYWYLWDPTYSYSHYTRDFSFVMKVPVSLFIVWGFGLFLWLCGMLMGIPNLNIRDIFLYFTFAGLFVALFPESGVLGGIKGIIAIVFAWEYANKTFWLAGILLFIAICVAYGVSSTTSEDFPQKLKNWRARVLSEIGQVEKEKLSV